MKKLTKNSEGKIGWTWIIEYNKDMFIFLEDGMNGFGQKSPKILTSDGVVGYIVPNYVKRVK